MAVVAAVAALGAVVACGPPPPVPPTTTGRVVVLPPVPVVPRAGIDIDPAGIDAAACELCELRGGRLGVEEFLYGELPLGALRTLAEPDRATPRARALGDLVVSGYHGGRWLAAGLFGGATTPPSDDARAAALALGDGIYGALAGIVAGTAPTADTADPEGLPAVAALLLAAYGYNRGYLDVAVADPPPGATPPAAALACPDPLSCTSSRFPLDDVDRWRDAGAKLAGATPGTRWADARAVVDALLAPSVEAGRGVWEAILAGTGFPADGYGTLIDTSAAFLAVTGMAMRAAATAWADRDPTSARVALDLTAGMLAWAGSYFLGLAAPPGGPLPTLDCPGA